MKIQKYIILIILLSINFSVFSQKQMKIDSFIKKINIAQDDTNKVNLLNELAVY